MAMSPDTTASCQIQHLVPSISCLYSDDNRTVVTSVLRHYSAHSTTKHKILHLITIKFKLKFDTYILMASTIVFLTHVDQYAVGSVAMVTTAALAVTLYRKLNIQGVYKIKNRYSSYFMVLLSFIMSSVCMNMAILASYLAK